MQAKGRYLNVCILADNQTTNLGLSRAYGRLTSENILKMFLQKLASMKIDVNVLVGVTSDGCASMVKMGRLLRAEQDGFLNQLCHAHGIHLVSNYLITYLPK